MKLQFVGEASAAAVEVWQITYRYSLFLQSLNGRIANVLRIVAACVEKHGSEYVMQDDHF